MLCCCDFTYTERKRRTIDKCSGAHWALNKTCHMKNDFTFKTVNWWKMLWWSVSEVKITLEKNHLSCWKMECYTQHTHKSIVITVNGWLMFITLSPRYSADFAFARVFDGISWADIVHAVLIHTTQRQMYFMYKPNCFTWIMVSRNIYGGL